MYIEEIILEGFKTYVNRTVITAFDPQFNAITGYNGSGKSNILDAIQFLLGSTNKQMLRLKSNFTEVIYKQGCSGIQKASVSIKFKCIDKNMRPSGYESCETLLVTRQINKDKVTKFFVNGLSSTQAKVKSLFRSVHLNIQNPHFLVKQGQITKIINLKPQQLLSMIEETAGTAIYNKTRNQSEKMIEKKQIKMKSIHEILNESIKPQMEKLKADRKRYTAYKDKQTQMKQLNESIKIYEFTSKRDTIQKKDLELSHHRQNYETKQEAYQNKVERLTEIEGQTKILKNKQSNQIFKEYNDQHNKLINKKTEQKHFKKRLQKMQNDSIQIKQESYQFEEQIERKKQELQWKSKQLIQQEKNQEEIQGLLREINASKGSDDARKIQEKQLNQEKEQIKDLELQIRTMKSKLDIIESQENLEKRNRAELQSTSDNLANTLKQLERQIAEMSRVQPPQKVEDPELTNNYLQSLESEKTRMVNQHYQLRFSYNDPVPNFDRSKIKGKLFMLFKVKEKLHEKALQIGAGGKLHNIVVQNEIISKMVIERECFGKNVSIIPNNKIRFKELRSEVINEAKRIAQQCKGLAKPAFELIQFDYNIKNSIMYAFSGFIICSSPEIAKKIAFNSRSDLSCKCVTYEGDIFERGTLTGGHMNANTLILNLYSEYREIQKKIGEERKKLEQEKRIYNQYMQRNNEYKKNIRQIESKQNRMQKIKQRMTDLSMNYKKRNFNEEREAVQNRISSLNQQLNYHRQKQTSFKENMKKGVKSVDDQKKQMEADKKKQDAIVDQIKKSTSLLEVQISSLVNKTDAAKENEKNGQEEILKIQQVIAKQQKEILDIQREFQKIEEKKRAAEREQAISQSKLDYLLKEQHSLKNEIKKMESEINHLKIDISEAQRVIELSTHDIDLILEECSWIDSNKDYDINTEFDYEEALREYRVITSDVDKLRKTAKMTIDDHSYEKLEEQYKSLLDKRGILENDKLTLINNMNDLDDKRMKTLEHCYRIVKQNLGKIFNDLLPGATAHLNLIDESDVTKGAELQVQFNKVKKQLSQLSGGQRSLLALSFILALLLYKPSPFYILDEIDSALDLSHTENIGYMISQRFPQSQFILISLKEGMYQNANVLYKVHFSQGQSKVDRQVLKKK